MSDINLLPEDIKKKKEGLKSSSPSDFKVELTAGQKLKKYHDNKAGVVDRAMSWFRPKKNKEKIIFHKDADKQESFSQEIKKEDEKNLIHELPGQESDKVNNIRDEKIVDELSSKELDRQESFQQEKKHTEIDLDDFDLDQSPQRQEVKLSQQPNSSDSKPIQDSKFKNETELPVKKIVDVNKEKNQPKLLTKKKRSFFSRILKMIKKIIAGNQDYKSKLDVNLLPTGVNLPRKESLYVIFISAFVLSVMAVVVSYFAIDIYKVKINKEYSNIKGEINSKVTSLNEYDALIEEMTDWKNKVDHIRDLFKHHVYWTKFFTILEDHVLKDVYFSNFASSLDGNLTLSGVAPDYHTVSQQWEYFKNSPEFVDNVVINGASLSVQELESFVNFSVTLDLADDIFVNFQEKTNEEE